MDPKKKHNVRPLEKQLPKPKAKTKKGEIETVGEEWRCKFRRMANEQGVSEKLRELDEK
jgi:hypothetical protein